MDFITRAIVCLSGLWAIYAILIILIAHEDEG